MSLCTTHFGTGYQRTCTLGRPRVHVRWRKATKCACAPGAGADAACAGLVGGEGGVVSASRSVIFPKAADGARTRNDWQAAIEAAIMSARSELKAAALA